MAKKEKKDKFAELEQLSVDELKVQKTEIQSLLSSLEDDYRKAAITEKSYNEVKKKNSAKLERIVKILTDMGITDESEAAVEKTEKKTEQVTPPAVAAPLAADFPTPAGVSEAKFMTEIEKLNALMGAMKESRSSLDDKLMRLTESLGEIRSLVYQREGIAKEQDLKLETIDEQMESVNPEKIEKEFAKRDKNVGTHDMKIEKLEFKTDDLMKGLSNIRALLKSIGGLENISTVNHDITEKIANLDQRTKKVDRLSNKIEGIFVDMNKKMEDFFLYKAKQETLDELLKELMKTTDSLSIELKSYVSKEDLESLKQDISGIGLRLGEMKKLMNMVIPIVKMKIPQNIQNLQKEKEDIETLMASLEDSFRGDKISKKEYKEAKRKNQEKLEEVGRKLDKEWHQFQEREKLQMEKSSKPALRPVTKEPIKKPQTKPAVESEPKEEITLGAAEEPVKKGATLEPTVDEITVPIKEKPKQESPQQIAPQEPKQKEQPKTIPDPGSDMLADLQDLLNNGLITKEAFEKAKKSIESTEGG